MHGGSDVSKKVGDNTVAEKIELEEDKEEVERVVLGCEVDEISIISVVYTNWRRMDKKWRGWCLGVRVMRSV